MKTKKISTDCKGLQTKRTFEATLLDLDSRPLSTVKASLQLNEDRCILRPPEGAALEMLLAKGKILKRTDMENWLLSNGKILGEFLEFDLELIIPD